MKTRLKNEREEAKLVELVQSRPYVEPGPARWEFEKRRLMARLTAEDEVKPVVKAVVFKRASLPAYAGAAAALATLALVLVIGGRDGAISQSVSVSGAWNVSEGDPIAMGSPFEVPSDAEAHLSLPDQTELWLAATSSARFADTDVATLDLATGHILARVTKQDDLRVFSIVTPHANVQVLGTTFSVRVGAEDTVVRLHQGKVRVSYNDETVVVDPGHQVRVTANGFQLMREFDEADARLDLALSGQNNWSEWLPTPDLESRVAIAAAVATLEPNEDMRVEDEASRVIEEPVLKEAPRRRNATRKAPVLTLDARVKKHYGNREYDEVLALTDNPELRSELKMYRGRALERLGRGTEAVGVYTVIADADVDGSMEAAYLAAKLYYRQGRFVDSRNYADQVRVSGGPVAEPSSFLALRALIAVGSYNEAAKRADEYLRRYPSGIHGEDVLFFLGFSQFQEGDKNNGRATLLNYLNRYKDGRHAQKARKLLSK